MFTGIVETLGKILALTMTDGCHHLQIAPLLPFTDLALGQSIAVNGACLTVTAFDATSFAVTAVPETLRVTNLGNLQVGSCVNLERSLQVGARLGGHYVQGHVEATGKIIAMTQDAGSTALLVRIAVPAALTSYIVHKGYICIDGMSITVMEIKQQELMVTFIPHTQQVTIIQGYVVGTLVNLEVDMLGKYVEKILGGHQHATTT